VAPGMRTNSAPGAVALTVTTLLAVELPAAFVAASVTVYEPAATKAWVGLWRVLVAPSPKLQDQEAGLPVDASVNWTDWPVTGEDGVALKEATGAAPVSGGAALLELEPQPARNAQARPRMARRLGRGGSFGPFEQGRSGEVSLPIGCKLRPGRGRTPAHMPARA
jgi:hypothetical protein